MSGIMVVEARWGVSPAATLHPGVMTVEIRSL